MRARGLRVGAAALALVALSALGAASPASAAQPTYRGPGGNSVVGYCRSHLPDDTPGASRLPGRALYCQLQWTAARFGYAGPIDGQPGSSTWRGVQRYLYAVGTYSGPITGALDLRTRKAIEAKAATAPQPYRDEGSRSGRLDTAAWRGFAYFLHLPWDD